MKIKIMKQLITGAVLSLSAWSASAQTVSFNYDYMATNQAGSFAGHGSTAVAKVTFTDVAAGGTYLDAAGKVQNNANGGVKATFTLLANGLQQFSSGKGNVYVASFETNFPNTSICSNATCGSTGTINGYDTDGAGGLGNQWAQGAGASFSANGAGGVEWAENGNTNGWGKGTSDPSFEQENNWGSGSTLALNSAFGQDVSSTIIWYNTAGRDEISVANLLANPVANALSPDLPAAYSWIKIRSNTGLAASRGLVSSGWWGNTTSSGATASGRYQLDILAVNAIAAVPEPSSWGMILAGLGMLSYIAKRRKS